MGRSRDAFRELVERTREDRAHVRRLVGTRQWRKAEPDKTRLAKFVERRAEMTAARTGAEALQGDTIDLQPVSFLPIGARVQRAVAYVEVIAAGRSSCGSGFLISPDLFITNQHVVSDADAAHGAQITFDKQAGDNGRPIATTTFLLDPERCALFSPEDQLDYAVIALGARLSGTADPADLGYCPLSNRPDKHRIGMNVNIIQHPGGAPKLIAVRENLLTHRTDRTLLYETDTDHGSSGSPVFNDMWEVIALHHYGEPFLERTDVFGEPISQAVNEGVRISAIYADLAARLPAMAGSERALLGTALNYDKQVPAGAGDRALGPPRPSREGREAASLGGSIMASGASDNELKVIVPIEVTVRLGTAGGVAGRVVTEPAAKVLTGGAEKLRIDKDYSNRNGYVAGFIPGVEIRLPEPNEQLAKQIAPLRGGEPEAEKGVLRYEHFSVVMNKAKRIAMFTAANIDGNTYLSIDRNTGKVKDAAEGESWFLDPRISASFFLGQSFYSAWSIYFDRGHLVRRTDPTWGEPEEAERANADTYHFTNCSPQHFRFNQSTKFWQGAERYILENGVLASDSEARLCVFQGPIFSDALDRWADDVQIPSSFFKVVVWRGEEGLKAVGLVVDQLALLDEKRTGIKRPSSDEPVAVNQWRVEIAAIEKRTGLNFGAIVRDADTIRQGKQPTVGEAQIMISSFKDILR